VTLKVSIVLNSQGEDAWKNQNHSSRARTHWITDNPRRGRLGKPTSKPLIQGEDVLVKPLIQGEDALENPPPNHLSKARTPRKTTCPARGRPLLSKKSMYVRV